MFYDPSFCSKWPYRSFDIRNKFVFILVFILHTPFPKCVLSLAISHNQSLSYNIYEDIVELVFFINNKMFSLLQFGCLWIGLCNNWKCCQRHEFCHRGNMTSPNLIWRLCYSSCCDHGWVKDRFWPGQLGWCPLT